MDSFESRLQVERNRLGYTQAELAAVAGVQKLAQIKYEKGERTPSADYLIAVSGVGVDPLFVLLGHRSNATTSSHLGASRATSHDLPAEELKLLKRFRKLGEVQRKQALQMIDVLAAGGSMGGTTTSHSVSAHGPNSLAVGNVSGSSNVRIKRS